MIGKKVKFKILMRRKWASYKDMDIDLTKKLRDSMAFRPRIRGRYNSSEVWGINNGYTTPEQWLNAQEKSTEELLTMWAGTGMHNQIERLLGTQFCEKKIELVYKDIVLVAKADFMPPEFQDEVWEFKTSENKMEKAKPWAEHQVKLYCSLFNKKQGVVYQPLQDKNGLYLKEIGRVNRDDKWFEEQLELLYGFHQKVEKLWK